MSVTDSWVAGREAVLAFEHFCLDQRWVWHEVPGHADFGKDGYVDVTEIIRDTYGWLLLRADQRRAVTSPQRWFSHRGHREQPPPVGGLDSARNRDRVGPRL
jgi:hypothetical protein